MASKLAIVFGATGNVGAGIARQLVKNGSKVVLPVRNVSKLSADIREAATAKPDTVTVIEADTATSEGMSKVSCPPRQKYRNSCIGSEGRLIADLPMTDQPRPACRRTKLS